MLPETRPASANTHMENVPPSISAEKLQRPSSSLAGRLLNVFAAPGDVFDGLKTANSSVANWLVPILIVMLVTITSGDSCCEARCL